MTCPRKMIVSRVFLSGTLKISSLGKFLTKSQFQEFAPEVKDGVVIMAPFNETDPKSLNPTSLGSQATENMPSIGVNSDMDVDSIDPTQTMVYNPSSSSSYMSVDEDEENKQLEDMTTDQIYCDGNKDIEQEDGNKAEIRLSDLKSVGALGQGASGTVEKCFHKPTKTRIALKKIPVDTSDVVKKQLLLEIKTLHDCECDYIVRSYGAFLQGGSVHIALEYMDAGSLEDIMKKAGRMSEEIIGLMTIQMLRGLDYLH